MRYEQCREKISNFDIDKYIHKMGNREYSNETGQIYI